MPLWLKRLILYTGAFSIGPGLLFLLLLLNGPSRPQPWERVARLWNRSGNAARETLRERVAAEEDNREPRIIRPTVRPTAQKTPSPTPRATPVPIPSPTPESIPALVETPDAPADAPTTLPSLESMLSLPESASATPTDLAAVSTPTPPADEAAVAPFQPPAQILSGYFEYEIPPNTRGRVALLELLEGRAQLPAIPSGAGIALRQVRFSSETHFHLIACESVAPSLALLFPWEGSGMQNPLPADTPWDFPDGDRFFPLDALPSGSNSLNETLFLILAPHGAPDWTRWTREFTESSVDNPRRARAILDLFLAEVQRGRVNARFERIQFQHVETHN